MEVFSQNIFDDNNEACLPPGFRFHPTDEELITCYLLRKVLDGSFTGLVFADVDLNKCEPWELPRMAKMEGKEWYFFSLRDRKYPTGLRTNRATEAGYWKATGKDRAIYSSKTSALVGMKKTLVFYRGRAPRGEKSNWVMHEYRLDGKLAYHFLSTNSKDEWVISRVFKKSGNGSGSVISNDIEHKPFKGVTNYPKETTTSSSTLTCSLPPLLDASNNYYEVVSKQHVPCFSTSLTTDNFMSQTLFDIPPPLPLMSSYDVTLQYDNNTQVCFFDAENSPSPLDYDQKVLGPTELDCIWSF